MFYVIAACKGSTLKAQALYDLVKLVQDIIRSKVALLKMIEKHMPLTGL